MQTAEELLSFLDELGIPNRTHHHPPVFTVEESRRLRGELPGGHTKNLFLRDKHRNFWLVVALERRRVDLKALRRPLGARKSLSFASAELLREVLGVDPGSVTPFALVNDRRKRVRPVLDRALLGVEPLNFHPLRNDQTTAIAPDDLLRFLGATGHEPLVLDLEAFG